MIRRLVAELEAHTRELARSFPEISAVYLFGSQAEGKAHSASDIDLAVVSDSNSSLSFLTIARYQVEVSSRLRTDSVDVLDLRTAWPALQFAVLSRGHLIYCRDPDQLACMKEYVLRTYSDIHPYRLMSYRLYRNFLKQRYLSSGGNPMLDVDRITEKINYIRQTCLPVLRDLSQMSEEEFLNDMVAVGGARYYLQTAVEVMLDINTHVLSQRGLGTFETHAQTLKALVVSGVLSKENLSTYIQMVGLRNRLVHVYEQIDNSVIHQILTDRLSDFETYIAEIAAFLDQLDQAERAG